MPIEIKELHIKTKLSDADSGNNSGGGNENGGEPNAQLINSCVEKVLEILKDKADR